MSFFFFFFLSIFLAVRTGWGQPSKSGGVPVCGIVTFGLLIKQ